MGKVVHKAVRPKQDYLDPSLCGSFFSNAKVWYTNASFVKKAHEQSRTTWDKVTCSKCLAKRKKRDSSADD